LVDIVKDDLYIVMTFTNEALQMITFLCCAKVYHITNKTFIHIVDKEYKALDYNTALNGFKQYLESNKNYSGMSDINVRRLTVLDALCMVLCWNGGTLTQALSTYKTLPVEKQKLVIDLCKSIDINCAGKSDLIKFYKG